MNINVVEDDDYNKAIPKYMQQHLYYYLSIAYRRKT
jgi:hypothetical protein